MVPPSEMLQWVNESEMLVAVVGRAATYLVHTTCQLHVIFLKSFCLFFILAAFGLRCCTGLHCCACGVGVGALL